MAEKPDKKPEDKAPPPAPAAAPANPEKKAGGGGGLLKSTPVLLGVVMVVEAAALLVGFKMLNGGPKAASASDIVAEEGAAAGGGGGEHGGTDAHGNKTPSAVDPKKQVDLLVLDFRAPNKANGRTFLYDVTIYVVTRAKHQEALAAAIKERDATIKDRIRRIVAQSNPDLLGGGTEPGLETFKRQVKFQLGEILGEDKIEEVLIPKCIGIRTEI